MIEWIFSGIGVAFVGWVGQFVLRGYSLRRQLPAVDSSFVRQRPVLATLPTPQGSVPYLFILPNGSTVDPMAIHGIKVSDLVNGGLRNVCYLLGNAQISCFHTHSKAEAIRVARELVEQLNIARGYRQVLEVTA